MMVIAPGGRVRVTLASASKSTQRICIVAISAAVLVPATLRWCSRSSSTRARTTARRAV